MSLEGKAAPEFELPGSDGKSHKLSDQNGKTVVVYFYPKDNTPGCTTQACDFRDNMAQLQSDDVVVYGVSKDSLKSHDKFVSKYDLNFVLLSDESLDVHKAYDAWGEKKLYGKVRIGVIRSTIIVGPDGVVLRHLRNVKAKGHVARVLKELDKLK